MKKYKAVLILKSDLKKDQKDTLMGDLKSWIGNVTDEKIDSLGDRKLAYPIKKQKTGEYVVMQFSAPTIPTDVNAKIQMNESILRYLLVLE